MTNIEILFVDDMKQPHNFHLKDEDVFICRTAESAMKVLETHTVSTLYLDHDLSEEGMNGYQLLKAMVSVGRIPKEVKCISWNPGGAKNIQNFCADKNIPYERIWGEYIQIGD